MTYEMLPFAVEQGQLLQVEDIVPLGGVPLRQDGHAAHHLAPRLVHQALHRRKRPTYGCYKLQLEMNGYDL